MNIDHLKDKFDLNELEVSLLEYIKKNQTESESKMDGYRRGEYSGKTDLLISNDAVYQTQNDLEFVEETIQDEERYDVDGFLPKSDISNF